VNATSSSWTGALLAGALVALATLGGGCRSPRPTGYINVTYTPSIETAHYRVWAVDEPLCVDSADPRVDDAWIREQLLEAVASELTELGFEQATGGRAPDFLVSYHVHLGLEAVEGRPAEWARSSLTLRDARLERLVWRGERKIFVTRSGAPEVSVDAVRLFVRQLMEHTDVLWTEPEDRD